jgi:hypothetical protein
MSESGGVARAAEVEQEPSRRGDAAAASVVQRDCPPHLFKLYPREDRPPRPHGPPGFFTMYCEKCGEDR